MRNKIQLIDINVLSSYMGKFQTAIVAVLVLGVTVSALTTGGGLDAGRGLQLGVPSRGSVERTIGFFEPLRVILQEETGRPVTLSVFDSTPGPVDLALVSPADLDTTEAGLRPVIGFSASPTGADQSVLIASQPFAGLDGLDDSDAVFTGGRSLNGFWIPLSRLERAGGGFAGGVDDLAVLGSPADASAVVFAVLHGRYAVGACRQSDVDRLAAARAIPPDAVHVVDRSPAVPEWILTVRPGVARKHGEQLARIADRLSAASPSVPPDAHAELLRSRGLVGAAPINDRVTATIGRALAYRAQRKAAPSP